MKSKKQVTLIIFCVITLLLVCSAYAEPIKLRFNYSMPLKKSIAGSWHWYGDAVENQAKGQVKFEYFPLSGLFPPKAVRDNIIAGTADLSNLSISTENERMPLSSITSLPTIYFPDTVQGNLAATETATQLIKEFPEMAAEYRDFKVVAFQYLSAYGVFTKKPAYLPSDLKGQKMRASAMHAEFVASVGGGPVNIVPPKTYMSLKTGVVDGGIMNMSQISDYKLWELGTSYTDVYMGRSMFAVIMNKESFNGLPKEIQQIMDTLSKDLVTNGADIIVSENSDGRDNFIKNGGQIIQLKPEQEKAWDDAKAGLERTWLEDMQKIGKGEPAEKMLKRFKEIAAEKIKNL